MIRPQSRALLAVCAMALVAAAVLAGCGSGSPSPTVTPAPTATPTATASPTASTSASPSPSPSPTEDLGLPHVNAALEDKLPGVIGGIKLEKFSLPLSTYMASSTGGDKTLFTPWLVHFGRTADATDIALAADLTQTENFFVQAIQLPGTTAADLSSEFAAVARAAAWPVASRRVADRTVLEITDPKVANAGGLGTAYVLAVKDTLFIVVTDDPALLLEALIKLPS